MKKQKRNDGITLIALVITIIVLLILAGVSITMLTGQNGVLIQAQRASEQTEIASEEERVKLAASGALLKDDGLKVIQTNLEDELENNFDISDFSVTTGTNDIGEDGFIVTITENVEEGRKYFVNQNGGVVEYKEPQVSELTDIYVTLYTDGTLAFSNNNQPIEWKTIDASYGNIKDKIFEMQLTEDGVSLNIPWMKIDATNEEDVMNQLMNQASKIKSIIINNKIVPENTSYWFAHLMNVKELEGIENLDTSNVTDMSNMFYGCSGLNSINLDSFNTTKVTDMSNMFYGCSGLNSINLSSFNTTKVTDMSMMFQDCSALTSIDLSSFNTKNVTNMIQMFWKCTNLESLDISSFDISEDTDITNLFTNTTYSVDYIVYVKNEEIRDILKSKSQNRDVTIEVKS